MEVTAAVLDKKFAEGNSSFSLFCQMLVYLLCDKILNGVDVSHMDINTFKPADFAASFHSFYVNKEPGMYVLSFESNNFRRPQPTMPSEVLIELFDLEETDTAHGAPLDIG
jgi:hypothetical protein